MNTLQAGATAPSFSLPNEQGDMINLADLAGKKVLLYFYPKAMTPGCTVQAQCLRDTQSEFTDRNVVVLGISPDAVKRLQKFMGKIYDGIHRISFLIDEQGVVEHVFDKFKTKDHHQVVLDFLNK